MSRREALAAEREAERSHARVKGAPARPDSQPVSDRRFAPREAHQAPQIVRSMSRRQRGKQLASVVVMTVVAAVTVSLSTPAEALMTSAQVQAMQIAAAQAASPDGQIILATGVVDDAVAAESYSALSKSEYAAQSGFSRFADTFVNNPFGTVQWPFAVGVPIGDRFGSTYHRDNPHRGLDFNPGYGAPIQAIADGTVTFVSPGSGELGVHIMITHVINGKTVTSVYAHMIYGSIRVHLGERVKVGQVIGNVGSTGYSTGPHLHFEIRLGGIDAQVTDPLPWLRANTN